MATKNHDEPAKLALRLGDKGKAVKSLQRSLSRVGFPVRVDGDFGTATLRAVAAHVKAQTRVGISSWQLAALIGEAADLGPKAMPVHNETRARRGLTTVGAWAGSATLANPARDVKFAADHGINRLDIVVNDHSKSREPRQFSVRSRDRILRLCDAARAKGIEVHLMSWVMPHRQYLDGAAAALVPLCREVGAVSLQWDAEEPWTLATRRMTYPAAASYMQEIFSDLSCAMGITGIGYASIPKLGPLAKLCDYVVPQAYSTRSSGLKPGTVASKFYKRWTTKFSKPVVIGLAAYRQKGIAHHTPESAMRAAAEDAARNVDTVIYWSLSAIRKSLTAARVVASLREWFAGCWVSRCFNPAAR